jgi:hypothetical protein
VYVCIQAKRPKILTFFALPITITINPSFASFAYAASDEMQYMNTVQMEEHTFGPAMVTVTLAV